MPAITSASISLSSSETSSSISSSESSSELLFESGSEVLINEFYLGESVSERALEIANFGDASVDLSPYEVLVFHGDETEAEYRIPLSGTLEPQSTFVLKYTGATSIEAFDMESGDFITNGTWPVALSKQGKVVDVLGYIGNQLSFATGDLVRKNEFRQGREQIEPYDWIAYPSGDQSHLGQLDCPLSEDEILQGPKLTASDFELPYLDLNTNLGGGGAREVSLDYVGDGDTTTFGNLPAELSERGYDGDSYRYMNIDTPEIQHGTSIDEQPWGVAAKNWNNRILRNASHILIQSVLGNSITETYGRLLGYVWYTNKANPSPSDYINLNYMTILEGYSTVQFSGAKTKNMLSRGISYYDYFVDANNRGLRDGYKVFGEKDPNFDY